MVARTGLGWMSNCRYRQSLSLDTYWLIDTVRRAIFDSDL